MTDGHEAANIVRREIGETVSGFPVTHGEAREAGEHLVFPVYDSAVGEDGRYLAVHVSVPKNAAASEVRAKAREMRAAIAEKRAPRVVLTLPCSRDEWRAAFPDD